MLRTLSFALAISASAMLIVGPATAETSYRAAVSEIDVADPDGRRDLNGWVWYPTLSDQRAEVVLGNPVWATVNGVVDADPAPGRWPVLLVSHGMYGNIYNQAWLGERLAEKGFIVAAVNHPGSTTRDRRPSESRRLWEGPRDMSRLLDSMLHSSRWAESIDADRIAAAGHSLGGLTVMRLAGAAGDSKRIAQMCDSASDEYLCPILERLNIAQHAEDAELIDGALADERIKAVVPLDLGGTQTLSTHSLGQIDIPVMVIGASRGEQLDQTIESEALAAALPSHLAVRFSMPDTGHFDFLGICTERGLAILRDEEPEDAVICEGGTDNRVIKHTAFAGAIESFLRGALQ